MVWIKLDDNFADHPKVVALSDGAFRMHLAGMAYCGKHLTDGRIPRQVVPRLTYADDWRSLRDELTVPTQQGRAPLWLTLPSGDFEIHDWLEYNKSAEKVLAERTSASIRDELRRHLQALDLSHKKELSATQVRQLPEHLQQWCVPTEHGFQVSAPTVTELLTADAALSADARPESAVSRQTDTGLERDFDACSPKLRPKLCGPVPVPDPEPDPDPEKAAAAPERACARGPARPPAEAAAAAAAAGKVDLDYAKTIGAAFGRPPNSFEEALIGQWQRAGVPPDLAGSIIREEVERRRIGGRDPIRSMSWFDARVREQGEILKIAIAQRPEPPTEPGFDFRAFLEQLQDQVPEQFSDIRRELWRMTMQNLDPHELTAELELLDRRLLTKAWEIAGDAKQQEIHQAAESSRAALAARVAPEALGEAVLRAKREIARSALGLPRLDPMLAWAEADTRAMSPGGKASAR